MTDFRTGHGYDVHALADDLRLRLAGVDVPFEKGCVAHSDGDAAVHALCDALLGAAAMGDIGTHFPDSDERYRGIDSLVLLAEVSAMLGKEGYAVSNADITIALQRPKLAPYIKSMREAVASALGIESGRVSVKATTTERLGFVGRGEGVEAFASVLIYRP